MKLSETRAPVPMLNEGNELLAPTLSIWGLQNFDFGSRGRLKGPYGMLEIELGLASCKAKAPLAEVSL